MMRSTGMTPTRWGLTARSAKSIFLSIIHSHARQSSSLAGVLLSGGAMRLKQLRGPLAPLKNRVAFLNDDKAAASRARDRRHEWRAWYKTQAWRRLRWKILTRDLFTCQRCGKLEGNTSLLVADHKVPHRGDEALFFDEQNIWCLCKQCHDSAKQAEERAAAR
jgi:5-methylcytosine-specific restriction enzyme A